MAYMSASGMNFLFMGVSRVTGRRPRVQEELGIPEEARDRLAENTNIWSEKTTIKNLRLKKERQKILTVFV